MDPVTITPEAKEVLRRMDSDELYVDVGPGLEVLEKQRIEGKKLALELGQVDPTDISRREQLLQQIFGAVGAHVWIEPPLYVAYGIHTHVGSNVYMNFGTTLIDDSEIVIGNGVMFGPHVTITTAGHPLHPEQRSTGQQFSSKVTIEDGVWIGANVTVLPGITIGEGSVVAAGAVVTANVPPMVIVGGVPARVIREINEDDNDWKWSDPKTLTRP